MNYFFGKNRNSLVNERTSYTPTSSPKVSPRKLSSDSEFLLKPPSKEIFENLKKESLSETKEWNSVHSSSDLKIWFRKSNDSPIEDNQSIDNSEKNKKGIEFELIEIK